MHRNVRNMMKMNLSLLRTFNVPETLQLPKIVCYETERFVMYTWANVEAGETFLNKTIVEG